MSVSVWNVDILLYIYTLLQWVLLFKNVSLRKIWLEHLWIMFYLDDNLKRNNFN